MSFRRALLVSTLLFLPLSTATFAQHHPSHAAPAESDSPKVGQPSPDNEPKEFRSRHSVKISGRKLDYTAVAGEIRIRGDDGQAAASIFTISYLLDGVVDASRRPITFLFNGGPGSTAVWLHLGAFGPRQIDLGEDPLDAGAPPYPLRANPHTLLDVTDLVFVDPVGTGYSHALGEGKDADYWGVDEDSASMARFIRTYLTHHQRWSSPKYLAGESYGTIRVSVLVRDLQLDLLNSVALNGVILISAALDPRIFVSGAPGNELNYVTNLPTYAATAYYHDQLPDRPADLKAFLRQAREFAATDYLTALFRGDSLPPDRAAEIADKLHGFTGLSEAYLRRANLRVTTQRFLKELLRDRGETVAHHDTRFRGQDADDAGEFVDWDPFLFGIAGPFVTAINSYLGEELGVAGMDRPYQVFAQGTGAVWKRPQGQNHAFAGFLNTTSYLAAAAATNKDFRVFAASGYHDLTTTFFGVEYTFDHSRLDKDRITLRNYYGGHMMYLYEDSLAQLSADIRAFITLSE